MEKMYRNMFAAFPILGFKMNTALINAEYQHLLMNINLGVWDFKVPGKFFRDRLPGAKELHLKPDTDFMDR